MLILERAERLGERGESMHEPSLPGAALLDLPAQELFAVDRQLLFQSLFSRRHSPHDSLPYGTSSPAIVSKKAYPQNKEQTYEVPCRSSEPEDRGFPSWPGMVSLFSLWVAFARPTRILTLLCATTIDSDAVLEAVAKERPNDYSGRGKSAPC